ncbi:hypothetical protein BJ508DRAFT_198571, partial [Ascobolus immersus RN42]
LNWVVRSPTNAAYKLPDNWDYLCLLCFYRISQAVANEQVYQSLLINIDQTGVLLNPGGDMHTYDKKGVKQVLTLGKGEKRAFTALLGITGEGDLLPSQCIWQGVTSGSLPLQRIRQPLEDLGHRFAVNPSKNRSHFSTLNSMMEYFKDIIAPHRQRSIEKHGLNDDAKCIILLDCWSVHTSEPFLEFTRTLDWLIVIFVPARCT